MIGTTLTVPNTKTSLYALLVAAGYTAPPETFAEVRIETDLANTDDIYVGVGNLSTTVYGARLPNSATTPYVFTFGHDEYSGNVRGIFLLAAVNNEKVHIFIR